MDHDLQRTQTGYTCTRCEQHWKGKPKSHCPWIKVYSWAIGPNRPAAYLTKTALHKKGLNPGGPRVGVIYNDINHTFYDLYDEAQATPRKATPAQMAALRKAHAATRAARTCKGCRRVQKNERMLLAPRVPGYPNHPRFEDGWCQFCRDREWERREYNKLIQYAASVLNDEALVVLDTETTGLHQDAEGSQEIIELAIVDRVGTPLFHSRFRPARGITEDAHWVNGLTLEMLAGEPTFPERWAEIHQVLQGKRVAAFNVDFDKRLLRVTLQRYGLGALAEQGIWQEDDCVMSLASYYFDRKRISLWESCELLGLAPGDHSALGDAQAALAVLRSIATREPAEERIPMRVAEPVAVG